MTIQDHIKAAKLARERVVSHCMALKVEETETHLLVIYPMGYQLDGVRVSKTNGIVWACERALINMEKAWRGEVHL